jgi:hypothetical protein
LGDFPAAQAFDETWDIRPVIEAKENTMNLKKAAVAVALGAVFSTAAFAQGGPTFAPAGMGFERRDAVNNERIEQGIRTGQLTPREAAKLRARQADIERLEARARRDGVITERERARIEVAQNELSRMIRFEKRDTQARR